MKKSKHDLLELVEKLINSIEFRNPGKKTKGDFLVRSKAYISRAFF